MEKPPQLWFSASRMLGRVPVGRAVHAPSFTQERRTGLEEIRNELWDVLDRADEALGRAEPRLIDERQEGEI